MDKTLMSYCFKFFALFIMLCSSAGAAAPVNVQILSATIKDQKIAGATTTLQKTGSNPPPAHPIPKGKLTLVRLLQMTHHPY